MATNRAFSPDNESDKPDERNVVTDRKNEQPSDDRTFYEVQLDQESDSSVDKISIDDKVSSFQI